MSGCEFRGLGCQDPGARGLGLGGGLVLGDPYHRGGGSNTEHGTTDIYIYILYIYIYCRLDIDFNMSGAVYCINVAASAGWQTGLRAPPRQSWCGEAPDGPRLASAAQKRGCPPWHGTPSKVSLRETGTANWFEPPALRKA